MRLATANLLSGRTPADGLVDPARLRSAVTALDADVLGLQEVDRFQERSGGADQAAEAAAGHDHRYVAVLTGAPGLAWQAAVEQVPELPSYGVALVSRLPVRAWHVLRLAPTRLVVPLPVPGTRKVLWLKDEPRVAIAAELDGLTVATTHLSFVAGWNVVQLRRVRRWLATLPGPHVLLGDLNLPQPVAVAATGWKPLVSAPTFPVWRPRVQLDHVLASRPLPVLAARAHPMAVSDHCALTVDLGALPTNV